MGGRFTNRLLYQLSYVGLPSILNVATGSVKSGEAEPPVCLGHRKFRSCDKARTTVEERRFSAAFPQP